MIAASLKDGEGDAIVDQLLRKDADVNMKTSSGQVFLPLSLEATLRNKISKVLTVIERHPFCYFEK